MLTEAEIRHELTAVTHRLAQLGPTATIATNAPVALEQLANETARRYLQWILTTPAPPQSLLNGPDTADAHQH